ncbi:MAG: glycosyltransferase [Clostridiales Family XIII bacterium]|jgi:glycosyltransferase involved in cell wall biosynthesis|nr:glycosyltransferase [Clostridiales Family XIII bacterium]
MEESESHYPLVSVIIPVFNAKRTIAACLDSVLAQTYEALEVLCIDDGSTDGTLKILTGYAEKDPRIRLLRQQENKGPAAARNLGLSEARGAYIGFVDADDFIDPPLYERLCALLLREEEAGLAVCEHYSFREGDPGERIVGFSERLRERVGACGESFDYLIDSPERLGFLIANISDFIWDKVFDAAIIQGAGLRFPEGRTYGEDTLFLAEYLSHARRAAFLGEPLYHYNAYSSGSITNTMSNKWFDIYANLGDLIEYYRDFYGGDADGFERIAPYLCDLSARYYDRRANALHRHGDKRFQLRFVKYSFAFLSRHFPHWQARMRKHPEIRLAGVKSRLFLMRLYILAPNALKRRFIPAKYR